MGELRTYLDGTPVGSFEMSATGNVTFTYDDHYRSAPQATPMSLSMRTSRASWKARSAGPFLAGLLPDSPERLRELAAEHHVSENPFRLLERIGRDAAGAVQLLPPSEAASDGAVRRGAVRRLDDEDFATMIDALAHNPGSWGGTRNAGRWSLAGAQSKVALFRFDDGAWGVPEDSTPTTHILKPVIAAMPDHDVNEFVSMEAARLLGLTVADHELQTTATGTRVFVSRRYDRVQDADGRWRRLHQEDTCQALSVFPARKYQEDGGPTVKQIAALLREAIKHPDDRRDAQRRFFDALVMTVAMLGTDAHAKNYSLVLDGASVRLAPLYDLGSHAAYPQSGTGALRGAMSIADEYRFDAIGEPHFRALAKSLDLTADEATDRYRRLTSNVADAFAQAAKDVQEPFAAELADAVAANAARRGW
ncbi:type II toxin-antitoxin system HipA family toxin [Microbacterium sp. M1A1_1b]